MLNRLILLALLLGSSTISVAQRQSIAFTVSDGQNTTVLTIGVDPLGTTTFVADLDLVAPPSPPSGAFDARLEVDGEPYYTKFLNNSEEVKRFTFKYAAASGSGPITISWDPNSLFPNYDPALPGTKPSITIKDGFGGTFYTANLEALNGSITPSVASPLISGSFILEWNYFVPVELTSFEGFNRGSEVLLRWATASETNNHGFFVEQRIGAAWETLGFVQGQGTTLEESTYSYTVGNLLPGNHAFRLRQMDYDGSVSFSPTVEVAIAVEGDMVVLRGQHPVRDEVRVFIALAQTQHVQVRIYDMLGREVHRGLDLLLNHPTEFSLPVHTLTSGLYVLQVGGEGFEKGQTFTIAR